MPDVAYQGRGYDWTPAVGEPMDELEIFTNAMSCVDLGERAANLDAACGGNTDLRKRIERLLTLHASDASMLNRRPAELLATMQDKTIDIRNGSDASEQEPLAGQLGPYLTDSTRPEALGRLGHYDLLEVLGQGGFGIVVKAFDNSLHRVVAIKVLAPQMAATCPPRKRFLREARAAAQVKHEHVVQIYAVEEQPIPYLVMEFVEGQTLQQKLNATGPLEPAEVVRLGRQIALGLAAAHDKGLIHRDIKPANVLVEAGIETRAKVTDFGLARAGDDASLTQSGVIAGTPMFMSPEQARGAELDHRSDLFSLGSVLYTMVTGRPPFRAPTTLAVLKRVAEDEPRPIRQVIADVPAGLCAVIMRLLEKDPANRFATARETADALAICLTSPRALPRQSTRRPAAIAAFAAFALLLGGGAAVWFSNPWRNSSEADRAGSGGAPKNSGAPIQTVLPPAVKADLIVTSEKDGGPGSLRDALVQAIKRQGPQTIAFAPELAGRTITLVEGWGRTNSRSALVIEPGGDITIDGGKGVTLQLSSPVKRRLLHVSRNAALTLKNLTLTGGNVTHEFDTGQVENQGGAVLVTDGTLVAEHCTFRDNRASIGGAISSEYGMLTCRSSTFDGNSAVSEAPGRPIGGGGGAINFSTWNKDKYTLEISGCTFTGNVGASGGGVWTRGEAGRCTILNSTFAGNRSLSGPGGAINNCLPNAAFTNLTIVDNTSASGSALLQYATPLRLVNCIVAGNQASEGMHADLTVVNGGTLTAESRNNLIGDASAEAGLTDGVNGNRLGARNLKLGSLAENGGPTKTIALLPGSPAIDAGDAALLPAAVKTDQRGLPRVKNGKVDIGAYQTQ
jgi:serine/threonine protein kinase